MSEDTHTNDLGTPTTLGGMLSLANWIEQRLVESGGEITPELTAMIEAQNLAVPDKVDSTVFVMKRMETVARLFKDEAARYTSVARGLSGAHDRLKAYVKFNMSERGIKELSGEANRFQLVGSAPKLVIDDMNLIPDVYTTPVVTREPNTEMILEALKAGREVPGAHLEKVEALRIYASKKVKDLK